MTRDEALAILKANEAELRRRGVLRAALFGSTARGEQRPDSDVDVLVEIDPERSISIYDMVGISHFLEDQFPAKVDLIEREALKDRLRPSVERDAVYAF